MPAMNNSTLSKSTYNSLRHDSAITETAYSSKQFEELCLRSFIFIVWLAESL